MHPRIAPGVLALLVGAVLAILLFVPLVAISYRRHGAMTPIRALGWAAVLVWLLGLWAYTMLPLPNPDAIRCTTPQLIPFNTIAEILRIHAKGTSPLANAALEVRLFNVVLFMPLGILLRGVFGRGWRTALVAGFGLSLLVELTQLTGTWGIYACSYRHFDVDDLISNTAGALLGWAMVWAVTRGRAIDTRPVAPRQVTAGRRLTGMLADWLLAETIAFVAPGALHLLLVEGLGMAAGPIDGVLNLGTGALAALLVHGVVLMVSGATIGEHAVLLRGDAGTKNPVVARAIRFATGIGGYIVLMAMPGPLDLLALFLVGASVAGVFRSREHRGLSAAAAGMELVDLRP